MTTKNHDKQDIVIRSGNLQLECQTKTVLVDDHNIRLKGLSYHFLEALLLSQQTLVTYEQLAKRVWNRKTVSEETIAQRASLVRKAIGDYEKRLFETVRGTGYQWLQRIEIISSTAAKKQPETDAAITKDKKWLATGAVLLFITLTIIAYQTLMTGISDGQNTEKKSSATKIEAPLLLQRADDYAAQHTDSANRIALNLYQQYLDSHADTPEVLFNYASALIERAAKFDRNSQSLKKAEQLINRLQSIAPEFMALNWLTGYYHDVAGDIDKAIQNYEQSLSSKEQPRERTAGSLAYLYTQRGRLFEATQLNQVALQGKGLYRLLQLSEILYLVDMEPEAEQWIEAAYQFAPDDGFTAAQYARYNIAKGQLVAAQEALNRFHELNGPTAYSLLLLAQLDIYQSRWQKAARHLNAALDIDPETIYALSVYYWLHKKILKRDDLSVSRPVLNESAWPKTYIALSIFHLADGDGDGAVNQIDRAYEKGYLDHRELLNNPIFAELKNNSQYQDIINKMRRAAQAERAKIALSEIPELSEILQAK